MTTYFIATKHAEFAERSFEEGSTVIDPWRYIPDQEGVTVKRIGENKPTLISILVPSRGRPREHTRLLDSLFDLATHPRQVEVITRLDSDDDHNGYYWRHPQGVTITGDRVVLSALWNECFEAAKGDILMHCGDDIVFHTPGWDVEVRKAFDASEDKILLVHGDDMSPNTDALATHGFLHRRWVETVGYFVPPYFSSDWNDVWLTEVADMIGRRVKIPIVTEHMHYAFEKSPYDATYREREERGRRDGVVELYKEMLPERRADAKKLKEAIAA